MDQIQSSVCLPLDDNLIYRMTKIIIKVPGRIQVHEVKLIITQHSLYLHMNYITKRYSKHISSSGRNSVR